VDRGISVEQLDAGLNRYLLMNDYSGRSYHDADLVPLFETLVEFATFDEMFFVEGGDEIGNSLVIAKRADMNSQLLSLCARHAPPAQGQSP